LAAQKKKLESDHDGGGGDAAKVEQDNAIGQMMDGGFVVGIPLERLAAHPGYKIVLKDDHKI
jgi:hypothetical protein